MKKNLRMVTAWCQWVLVPEEWHRLQEGWPIRFRSWLCCMGLTSPSLWPPPQACPASVCSCECYWEATEQVCILLQVQAVHILPDLMSQSDRRAHDPGLQIPTTEVSHSFIASPTGGCHLCRRTLTVKGSQQRPNATVWVCLATVRHLFHMHGSRADICTDPTTQASQ